MTYLRTFTYLGLPSHHATTAAMPRDRDDPEREQRRRERKERKRRERREREAREQSENTSSGARGAPVDLDEDVAAVDVDESNGGFNGADGAQGGASLYADEPSTLSSHQDRELSELQLLCDAASESDPSSWEKIRRWLRNHSADDARAAAERRGDYETTPLHLACRNGPPLDIVNMLLTASPRTVELADSFGWLPLVSSSSSCVFWWTVVGGEAAVDQTGRSIGGGGCIFEGWGK